MAINDRTYLLRRMIASCDAAKLAQHPKARKAHLTLAKFYYEALVGRHFEDAAPPAPMIFRPKLDPETARV